MPKIETYIREHKTDVDKWLVALFGNYFKEYMLDPNTEPEINTHTFCTDERRLGKCLEVFMHYGLYKNRRQRDMRDAYGRLFHTRVCISLNHEAVLKMAPQYGAKFEFKIDTPKVETDRILGYPAINNISNAGLIHLFFHQDEYSIYDRVEEHTTSRSVDKRRVVRIFPKDLEPDAERSVFEKALQNYYSNRIPEAFDVMFGYRPEVLQRARDYGSTELKDFDPPRVNEITMVNLEAGIVRGKLMVAYRMKEYVEACIRDLEALEKSIPETSEDFEKLFFEKLEPHIENKAPLMMMSSNISERELAALVLKGSNKGII